MNILVIFSNRLGDVIMSLSFIQGVKEVYPESKIYAVIGEELIEFIQHLENKVLVSDKFVL